MGAHIWIWICERCLNDGLNTFTGKLVVYARDVPKPQDRVTTDIEVGMRCKTYANILCPYRILCIKRYRDNCIQ